MPSPHLTETAPTPAAHADAGPAEQRGLDVGLLVLRLAVGLTVAAHGSQKLFGTFGGGGIDGTAQFFGQAGYPSPKAMAVVAGLTETLGGLGLALGLLAPLAGAAVFGTMLNALAVKWGGGFFAPAGIEYELLLVVAAMALTLTGPGRLAADSLLPLPRPHRLAHGAGTLLLGAVLAGVVLLLRS